MKATRRQAAKHFFNQCKKSKDIAADAVFDDKVVDVSDIDETAQYYGGFTFVPSIATDMCNTCRYIAAADAAHCEGKGIKSYGTTFEVVLYDANYNLVPILFANYVGAECHDYWRSVFQRCCQIKNFDVLRRTVMVHQEK